MARPGSSRFSLTKPRNGVAVEAGVLRLHPVGRLEVEIEIVLMPDGTFREE